MADKTAELRARHQAAVTALLARYQQLRSEVAKYNKALQTVMTSSTQQQDRRVDAAGGRDQ